MAGAQPDPTTSAGAVSRRGPLEAARLSPARRRGPQIERTLVLRSLDVARAGRLTQLVGPPGAGKTTALAQWRERLLAAGVKVGWYAAAEREREPAAFLHMLASAIHRAGVDMTATGLLDTLDADPSVALDAILLALEQAETEMVLIVDGFDRAETPGTNAVIQALVETAPDQVHLALSARRKPRLAVSALIAQGAVRTIDTAELRFGAAEIGAHLDLAADSADLAVIAERTEGWPVAVELFRLWRERTGAAEGLSALFSGRDGDVADYLAEQVFATLEPGRQALLVELSVLGDVSPALADRLRGREDSAALLEALAAALPGLVERHAEPEPSYRIHPLLADYARGRAELSAARARELHRRAALWFAQARRYPDAIAHAQAAADADFLTGLLAELPPLRIFLDAGTGELRAILRGLAPEQVAAHPRLRLMAALAAFKSGFFLEGRAMLEAVRADTDDFARDPHGRTAAFQVEARALELLIGGYIDGPEIDDAPLTAAIRAGAPDEALMWAWSENIMIVVAEMRGELAASREALARSKAIYAASGMTRFADFWLLNHEGLLALAEGAWRRAGELAAGMRRLRLGELASDLPMLAMARLVGAAADYERRFVEDAAEGLREGLEQLSEAELWFEPYAIAHAIMAEVAYRRGGTAELDDFARRAAARAGAIGVRHVEALLAAVRAAWLTRAGDPRATAATAEALARRSRTARPPWRLQDATATAVALDALARGDTGLAMDEAAALIAAGERGGRLRTLVKGQVLQALALAAAGRAAAALAAIEAALAAAAPEQAVAVFAEEGEAVEPLVRAASADETAPAPARRHAEAVLRALALGRRQVNALNEREAQIVAYLREGASNKLIARRLGLTENTIKFHMKRVFAKLGITSRRDAVAAAARLTAPPR